MYLHELELETGVKIALYDWELDEYICFSIHDEWVDEQGVVFTFCPDDLKSCQWELYKEKRKNYAKQI